MMRPLSDKELAALARNDPREKLRVAKEQARLLNQQRNMFGDIQLSPEIWPGNKRLPVEPGNLSLFAPEGEGGCENQDSDPQTPFLRASRTNAHGGSVVFFDNDVTRPDLKTLLRVLHVRLADESLPQTEYVAFLQESQNPCEDGYILQMRIVSTYGLRFLYRAFHGEMDTFPKQKVPLTDALWYFMEQERKRWGTRFWEAGEQSLEGMFNGDGDGAREELCFGLMVENGYYKIYRLWSRAQLVTK